MGLDVFALYCFGAGIWLAWVCRRWVMGITLEIIAILLACLVFGWPVVAGVITASVFVLCLFMIFAHMVAWVRGY